MPELATKPQESQEEITCCSCGHVVSQEKAYCDSCFEDKIIECDKCGNTINQEEERFCDECIGAVKDQLADALRELVEFRKRNQVIMTDTMTMIKKLLSFYDTKRLMLIGDLRSADKQADYDIYGDLIDTLVKIRKDLQFQIEALK